VKSRLLHRRGLAQVRLDHLVQLPIRVVKLAGGDELIRLAHGAVKSFARAV